MGTKKFRFEPGRALQAYATRIPEPDGVADRLRDQVERVRELQPVLYADARHALLLVFQGMDCAGKDSTIKHALSGVNPQGVSVASFKQPTANELKHSYLWRYWRQMPERGHIGVFNRSHYEEVIVMRVHPEYFAERALAVPDVLDDAFWQGRMQDLAALEDHLTKNGITVVKFFLHLSRDEQKDRLLSRIDRPHKNWKFDLADVDERAHWDSYANAYQAALDATHTEDCPWYIIPADHKPTMRALVAEIVAETLGAMPIDYPKLQGEEAAKLQEARQRLLDE